MSGSQPQQSISGNFIRGAGEVQDKRLWGPAKWVVQMVQYLIAILVITIGEAFKSIVTGAKPRSRAQVKEDAKKETIAIQPGEYQAGGIATKAQEQVSSPRALGQIRDEHTGLRKRSGRYSLEWLQMK